MQLKMSSDKKERLNEEFGIKLRASLKRQKKIEWFISGSSGAIASIAVLLSFLSIMSVFDSGPSEETIENKIQDLNNIKQALYELEEFIEKQKGELVERGQLVEDLKNQKEILEPLIEADKKLVESIMSTYEKRAKNDRWINIGAGFITGILSSLFAIFIHGKIRDKKKKLMKNDK
jgi:hypothetical protein